MKLHDTIIKSLINNSFFDRRKDNVYGECPWCGGNEFGVSLKDNHLFGCFRQKKCGIKGNIFTLLKKLNRVDLIQGETIRLSEKLDIDLFDKVEEKSYDINLPTIKPPIGFRRIFSNDYLEKRGFNSFDKYKVGMTKIEHKYKNRIIFLIEEEGEIKGYLGRTINNDIKPKYKNSETDFAKLLCGYDEINSNTKTVVLVEGLLSKENLDRQMKLDNNDEIKCCCTFGSKISIFQIIKLKIKNVNHIILMYEQDVIDKIQNYAFVLQSEFDKVEVALPILGKDPGDMNEQEFNESFSKKTTPENFFRKKVAIIELK